MGAVLLAGRCPGVLRVFGRRKEGSSRIECFFAVASSPHSINNSLASMAISEDNKVRKPVGEALQRSQLTPSRCAQERVAKGIELAKVRNQSRSAWAVRGRKLLDGLGGLGTESAVRPGGDVLRRGWRRRPRR